MSRQGSSFPYRNSKQNLRKILNIYGFWRNAENRSFHHQFVPRLKIKSKQINLQCENLTVMQIDFPCHRQMHDWGWISAYLKESMDLEDLGSQRSELFHPQCDLLLIF